LLYDPALAGRPHEIDVPTLVTAGSDDGILATGYAEKFASAIPGARFRRVEGACHYIPMDRANEFAERIAAFASNAAAKST
jgi:pimeloyl-ACP methyl ester carboxylesterase